MSRSNRGSSVGGGKSSSVGRSGGSGRRNFSQSRTMASQPRSFSQARSSSVQGRQRSASVTRTHSPNFRLNSPPRSNGRSLSTGRQQGFGGSTRRNFPNARWSGNRFVRDRAWFRGYSPYFWSRWPWYLDFYNTYYPYPLFVLDLFAPLVIAASIESYNQQTLAAYIQQREMEERAAGRAPADPDAHLVPNFAISPATLMWASPSDV